MKSGSKHAYVMLKDAMLNAAPEATLYWSFIMANKYGDGQACYDVFATFLLMNQCFNYDLTAMDSRTAAMAKEYLGLAYHKGHKQALYVVKQHPELLLR